MHRQYNSENFDTVIIATGVNPREPSIDGINQKHVHYYKDILNGEVTLGSKVAVVGAGGIGFDVAEFLASEKSTEGSFQPLPDWMIEWGIGDPELYRGGLLTNVSSPQPAERKIAAAKKPARKAAKKSASKLDAKTKAKTADANNPAVSKTQTSREPTSSVPQDVVKIGSDGPKSPRRGWWSRS